MEHWYGLPEALLDKNTIQDYPLNYNYSNEQHRFEEVRKALETGCKTRVREMEQCDETLAGVGFHPGSHL